ncbi:MAG: beta-galactosidase [Candidatus Omnitrophota bacterium]
MFSRQTLRAIVVMGCLLFLSVIGTAQAEPTTMSKGFLTEVEILEGKSTAFMATVSDPAGLDKWALVLNGEESKREWIYGRGKSLTTATFGWTIDTTTCGLGPGTYVATLGVCNWDGKWTFDFPLGSFTVLSVKGSVLDNGDKRSVISSPYTVPEMGQDLLFKEGNFDSDPEKELFMGNRFVSVIIEPQLGGVISSFRYRGGEFTQPQSFDIAGGGGGFFSDHVVSQATYGDWWQVPYRYEISENNPEKIRLRLSCPGKSSNMAWVTFNKTFTLRRNESCLQVDYDVAVSTAAQAPLMCGLWFHNFVGVNRGWYDRKQVTYFFPLEDGIKTVQWGQGPTEQWYYQPARGWTGLVDREEKDRLGLVFQMEYKYLKCFYICGVQRAGGMPTQEWRFNDIAIPHGDSFKTTIFLMPFHGLNGISGSGSGMVGNLNCEDNKVTATLVSGRKNEAVATLRYRVLPDQKWQTVEERKVSFLPDEPLSLVFDLKQERKGTHVFSLLLQKDGKDLLDLEVPKDIQGASGIYALEPKEVRYAPPAKEVVDLADKYISMEVETPHIKWAKPYYKGKTKAIVLMKGHYERDIIELAQRVDLDLHSTYIFDYGGSIGEFGDLPGLLTEDDLKEGMKKLLKDNPDWEVFVAPGYVFEQFPDEQQRRILERVKEGGGLVLINLPKHGPLASISSLNAVAGPGSQGSWEKAKDHFITAGIPFSVLPEQGRPGLDIGEYGKGRIAVFAYVTGWNNQESSLLPLMNNPFEERGPEPLLFKYFEYQFSILAKAVLWAAGKEPHLRIEQISAIPTALNLRLVNQGGPEKVNLTLKIKDKYYEPLGEIEKVVELPAGATSIEIPYSTDLPNGLNLFDLFIKDRQEKVINWGSTSLEVTHPVWIAKMESDKAIYQPGDEVKMEVRLEGEVSSGITLLARMSDGYGRIMVEEKKTVSSKTEVFSLKMEHPLNYLLLLETELRAGGKKIDSRCFYRPVKFALKESAHRGDPDLVAWTSFQRFGMNSYLFDYYCQGLEELGINVGFMTSVNVVPTYANSFLKHNLSQTLYNYGLGPPEVKGDPEHPERVPCLNVSLPFDEKIKEEIRSYLRKMTSGIRAVAITAADEGSYSPWLHDFCFCSYCMQAMRNWLREEYANLDALNHEWGTSFKNWDEVRPLTLKESKARGNNNFASWSDHRTFNEVTVANYFRALREAAEEFDPRLRLNTSGTQLPHPYDGLDYWLLTKALSGVLTYCGSDWFNCWAPESFDLGKWTVNFFKAPDAWDWGKWETYDHLFRGGTSFAVCGEHRLFTPDMRYSTVGQVWKQLFGPIACGVGRLLIESELVRDDVAILYSQRSLHIAYATGHPDSQQNWWG